MHPPMMMCFVLIFPFKCNMVIVIIENCIKVAFDIVNMPKDKKRAPKRNTLILFFLE